VSYGAIHPRGELWRIGIDSGRIERHALTTAARGISVRPNGGELSMARWDDRQQVWIIENFLPAAAKSFR
jgi:hypothetical protein